MPVKTSLKRPSGRWRQRSHGTGRVESGVHPCREAQGPTVSSRFGATASQWSRCHGSMKRGPKSNPSRYECVCGLSKPSANAKLSRDAIRRREPPDTDIMKASHRRDRLSTALHATTSLREAKHRGGWLSKGWISSPQGVGAPMRCSPYGTFSACWGVMRSMRAISATAG
jgi:hypothetical protein